MANIAPPFLRIKGLKVVLKTPIKHKREEKIDIRSYWITRTGCLLRLKAFNPTSLRKVLFTKNLFFTTNTFSGRIRRFGNITLLEAAVRTILENGLFVFSWFQPPTAKRVFKVGFFCLSALNLGYNLSSFHSYMANVSVFLLILAKEYTRWVHR